MRLLGVPEELTQPHFLLGVRQQGSAQNTGGELGALSPGCPAFMSHGVFAAIALHFLMKSAGSLQPLSAVFPALRAIVAFLATEPGTITELASEKSEPRHPGDWL